MKLLQTGDLHLRSSELDDQRPVLDWIAAQEADLVVIAGDLSGRAAPHLSRPAERNALLSFLNRLTAEGKHVVCIRGNHDVPEDWAWIGEDWQQQAPVRAWVTTPTTLAWPGLRLHCLPYPDRSWIAGSARLDREALTRAVEGALEAVCVGWAAERQPNETVVLSGHFATRGARTSTGQPLVGTDVELPVDVIDLANADLVLCNHVHLPQESKGVVHVGSPWPTDYGEEEDKRVVVYEVGGAWRGVETPCVGRVSVDLEWTDGGWVDRDDSSALLGLDDLTRVRLRLHYDEGQDVDLQAAEAMVGGARAVKLERVPRRTRRERAPEVVAAAGPVARYEAFEASESRAPDSREVALASALVDGHELVWGDSPAERLAEHAPDALAMEITMDELTAATATLADMSEDETRAGLQDAMAEVAAPPEEPRTLESVREERAQGAWVEDMDAVATKHGLGADQGSLFGDDGGC